MIFLLRQIQLCAHYLKGKTLLTIQWAEYSNCQNHFYFSGYYILIVYVNRVQWDIYPHVHSVHWWNVMSISIPTVKPFPTFISIFYFNFLTHSSGWPHSHSQAQEINSIICLSCGTRGTLHCAQLLTPINCHSTFS